MLYKLIKELSVIISHTILQHISDYQVYIYIYIHAENIDYKHKCQPKRNHTELNNNSINNNTTNNNYAKCPETCKYMQFDVCIWQLEGSLNNKHLM